MLSKRSRLQKMEYSPINIFDSQSMFQQIEHEHFTRRYAEIHHPWKGLFPQHVHYTFRIRHWQSKHVQKKDKDSRQAHRGTQQDL